MYGETLIQDLAQIEISILNAITIVCFKIGYRHPLLAQLK